MTEKSMPEQPRDLYTILTAALKEAAEQGFLEGVSDEELARMTIQARTRAAITETGVLREASETTEEERRIVDRYEEWCKAAPKIGFNTYKYGPPPLGSQEMHPGALFFVKASGSGVFLLPNPTKAKEVTPLLMQHFDLPGGIREVRKMKLVRPAWILDVHSDLGSSKKGKLVPADDVEV